MKVVIETIPHRQQRYPTVGDWYYTGHGKKRTLHIKVSDLKDNRHVEAVAIHELFEALACANAGITQNAVDRFDKCFEHERDLGLHGPADEPGDDLTAPYRTQHCLATAAERMYAAATGIDWNKYNGEIESLP